MIHMASKIEQIIKDIEEYIDNCKTYPLSSTKIIVNKDEIKELLRVLSDTIPDEIVYYQRIISNKDAILADAKTKAEGILTQAQLKTDELVNEHQIMQSAHAHAREIVMSATKNAQEILDTATNDSNSIRLGAVQYANDVLKSLEDTIAHSIESTKVYQDNYIGSLQAFYDIVSTNRAELNPTVEEESAPTSTGEELSVINITSDMLN